MFKVVTTYFSNQMNQTNTIQSLWLLAARLWIAKIFFMSGMTKIKSWDTTLALFTDEYQVPLIPSEIAAYLATASELSLPFLIGLGLLTPVASVGLLAMTLVIELFVYPGTTEHYYWMFLLSILIIKGPGKISVDNYISKFLI